MKSHSNHNTYSCSDGSRLTRSQIEKKIREAKKEKIAELEAEFGYVFCFDCGRNDCLPVDMSHDIPIKDCLESGRAELAFDLDNLTPRGRKCHQKRDKLKINHYIDNSS